MSRLVRAVIALMLLIIVCGVAGLGTLGVLYARNDIRSHQSDTVLDRAATISSIVQDALAGDVSAIRGPTGQRPFHLDVVARRYSQASPYLVDLISSHKLFTAVALYDSLGRLVVRIPYDGSVVGRRFGRQEYFAVARSQGVPHISRVFVQLGRPKVPVIAFSIRIFHGNITHGVLVATVPISSFDALVAPYVPDGWAVRVYDAGGDLISPSKDASGRSFANDPVVGPALQGSLVRRQVGGSLVVASPVGPYGWAVAVSQPKGPENDRLNMVTTKLSWYAGAATALALLAAILSFIRTRAPKAT